MATTLPPAPARPRWWPALLLLGLNVAALAWFQFDGEADRQERYLRSFLACLLTGVLLLGWCVGFSRFPRRIRLLVLAVVVAAVAGLAALLRIEGVTGDLVPIVQWRWTERGATAGLDRKPDTAPIDHTTNTPPAAAWPQFLGPDRDGTLPGPNLARDWSNRPPVEVWRIPVGPGWSGFAVAAGLAVTQEQEGPLELVTAYEAANGRLVWRHTNETRYATTIAGEGPRATPTIAGGRVFTAGGTGRLNCLDLLTGKVIWSHDVLAENGGQVPEWGYSASPLVHGAQVILPAGGSEGRSLVAYRAANGEFVWGGGTDPLGYSSPVLQSLAGQAQILLFNGRAVVGHDPQDGRVLWRHGWPTPHPHVANPVLTSPDTMVASAGYGQGAEAIRAQRGTNGAWSAARVWKSNRLKAKFSNFIALDGHLYGLDDGILTCLDAATGEARWKDGRYGHGQMIRVGTLLLLLAENGELVLVEPAPSEWRELARFRVFADKTWNTPALAGELAYLRNDREAVCLRLPVRD
jgi:outer membrane protein assembly factor BamB